MLKDCVKYSCFCSIQFFVDFMLIFQSNCRIPVHYCILEAASFEEGGKSIHMQIRGQVFWSYADFFRWFGTIKFLYFSITTFSSITLSVSWWFNVLHARTNICSLSFIVFASAPLFSAPLFGGSAAIEWITLSSSGVSVADSRAKTQRILQGNDSTIPRWVKTIVTSILW